MASGPGRAVLGWVAGVLGTGPPEVVCGLRDGASPWLLRSGGREVVLRVGRPAIAHELATEAAALELAAGLGVSVPELLGSDDGRAAGVPVVLSARLPGSSQIPREPDPVRLAELGRQAARLHAVTGLLDWDCAGAGDPGVDLGSLRCDAALCYGPQAPAHVLRGWQEQAGRPADRVAYWDLVAALSSPPDMGWFPVSMALQGRPDLDQPTMLARRNDFVRQAMAALR